MMEEENLSYEELSKPIKDVEEKWKLLPHFLKLRGLMRQHIDSFNHFINVDMKQIIHAKSNKEIRSEADSKFFLQYTDIYVGEPSLEEEAFLTTKGDEASVAIIERHTHIHPKIYHSSRSYLLKQLFAVIYSFSCRFHSFEFRATV